MFGHLKHDAPYADLDAATQIALVDRVMSQGDASVTPSERQMIEDTNTNRLKRLRRGGANYDTLTQQRID
jgi:hypothetical protein